uniref:Large ribosomal subunit protein uL4m n=1 Tax=Oryctolagus cuniculus TaxID=9986 RepID=A0A5F9CJK3_RABIT
MEFGWGARGSSLTLAHRLQGLDSLAGETALTAEKPQPAASPGLYEPVLRKCELPVSAPRRPVQAWVESLRGYEQERVGLAELHPDVFATAPRLDVLHQVAVWQKNFKRISYAKTKTRAEVRGGGRKPWQQKGSGRARHGSIRSPIWRGGECGGGGVSRAHLTASCGRRRWDSADPNPPCGDHRGQRAPPSTRPLPPGPHSPLCCPDPPPPPPGFC